MTKEVYDIRYEPRFIQTVQAEPNLERSPYSFNDLHHTHGHHEGGVDPCPRRDDSNAAVEWNCRVTDRILDDAVTVNLLVAAAATAAQVVLLDATVKLATDFGMPAHQRRWARGW